MQITFTFYSSSFESNYFYYYFKYENIYSPKLCIHIYIKQCSDETLTRRISCGLSPLYSGDSVKLLCITVSNDLTRKRHVDNIVKKAGKIPGYILYKLKHAGVNQADLVTIYISVVRPVVEYA